jgi:hypothetical protein
MAASLRPAVSGATPRSLRRVTALHGVGLLFGALFMALVLAFLGSAVTAGGLRITLKVLVAGAVLLAFLQVAGVRVPQSPWQVPDYWRRTLDADVLPVAYGAILGLGIFTAVVVGAFWVFVAATLLYPAPIALLAWAAYAVGRTAGFGLVIQTQPLERIFLTAFQRKALIIATAILAAVVVAF